MSSPMPSLQPSYHIKGRRKWKFLEPWGFDIPGRGYALIPQGFEFDGASVPRPLWWLFSPTGTLFIPSIVHDFAIRHGYLPIYGGREPYNDAQADQLFYELCRHVGLGPLRSHLAFIGVRLGSLLRRW